MTKSSPPPRKPQRLYMGSNGYTDQLKARMSGSALSGSNVNLHAVAANPSAASEVERRELGDAVQRRQVVENMMELKGTFFPGLDAIKQANETPETSETLKNRIQDLQKKYLEEVRTLYEWHAQDYYDDMIDLSRSQPDSSDLPAEAWVAGSRACNDLKASFDEELDSHQYAYLATMQRLVKERKELQAREAHEQRVRDQQFPATIEAYQRLRKDIKFRIATFLTADELAQDRMMTEFGWNYLLCKDLMGEYKLNEEFRAEVQQLRRDGEASDPRKARQ
ncbi:hypothetical protein C8Q80DRAFT_697126 [Daedaleopsis nitida]|nr:hypothetical protein C8Q80DRAFT_697126 [Daedaleopsis nitida]